MDSHRKTETSHRQMSVNFVLVKDLSFTAMSVNPRKRPILNGISTKLTDISRCFISGNLLGLSIYRVFLNRLLFYFQVWQHLSQVSISIWWQKVARRFVKRRGSLAISLTTVYSVSSADSAFSTRSMLRPKVWPPAAWAWAGNKPVLN